MIVPAVPLIEFKDSLPPHFHGNRTENEQDSVIEEEWPGRGAILKTGLGGIGIQHVCQPATQSGRAGYCDSKLAVHSTIIRGKYLKNQMAHPQMGPRNLGASIQK
jgi:hypothetical protein